MAGLGPGLDPAVEDTHPFAGRASSPESERVEHPPQPRGDPAADVVIADDLTPVADPDLGHARREDAWIGQGMTAGRTDAARVREILIEVEEDRTRDVA